MVSIFRALKFNYNKVVSDGGDRLNKKLSKFKNHLVIEYVFTFSRLVFTDI